MASISLIPLIEIFEENHYENIENNDDYVILWKKEWETIIDKIMIPKAEEEKDEYISIINRKMDRLIKSSNNEEDVEQLEFEKNILKLAAETNNEKLSFRIKNTNHVSLDKLKKIVSKFSNLSTKYGELIWDTSFFNEINFLQTTKWSFVINVSLPNVDSAIMEDFNKNQMFVDILEDVSHNEYDTILWNYHSNNLIKPFISWLKEFSDEVLGDAEMFYTTNRKLNKVINIISHEEKKQISESLKEIEETIQNPIQINDKEFTIVSTCNPIWNRIAKVVLLTTLDNMNDVEFQWSWISWEDLSFIKERNSHDESVFLRNINFIKLKDYYRIISAEIVRGE